MKQNYKNHIRFNPYFHFVTIPSILVAIGMAIYAYNQSPGLTSGLLILAFVLIAATAVIARKFSLKVQDRAARADEKLRYYILTQKMLPAELSMNQILALRFASDDEFVDLVDRTIKDKLLPHEIKKAAKNWRGDYHRI